VGAWVPRWTWKGYNFALFYFDYCEDNQDLDIFVKNSSESCEMFIKWFNFYWKHIQVVSVPLPIRFSVKNDNTMKCLSTNRADLKKFEEILIFDFENFCICFYGTPDCEDGFEWGQIWLSSARDRGIKLSPVQWQALQLKIRAMTLLCAAGRIITLSRGF
jgi:hypothetical protein